MSNEFVLPPVDIPDLSKLNALSEQAIIVRVLGSGGSSDHTAQVLLTNTVRLLDASIGDYQLGRQAILAFHARDPSQLAFGYLMRATTHFESCVWHLERFIKHVRALRSLKSAEPELKALVPKGLKCFQQASEHMITNLRHTLAHLEGAALRGELPPGATIALAPIEVGLRIAGHTIEWESLAGWLRDAHKCVEDLANFRPSPAQAGA